MEMAQDNRYGGRYPRVQQRMEAHAQAAAAAAEPRARGVPRAFAAAPAEKSPQVFARTAEHRHEPRACPRPGLRERNAVIHLTSTSAVSWPTPVAATVAPVAPVPAVPAAAGGGADQAQTGRHGFAQRSPQPAAPLPSPSSAAASGERPDADPAAPLLPRPAGRDAETAQTRRQAERNGERARERDRQAMEHLKQVLASVWAASAAVIDRALGLEAAEAPGSQGGTAPDLSQVAAALVARRSPPPLDPAMDEVVAYDERGNSSLMPLETGGLVNWRV